MVDAFMSLVTQKPPQRLDTLIEALKLDPEGYLTLTILIGLCKDLDLDQAMYALCEIQNAILPNRDNRRMLAAAAAIVEDWDSAFQHLDILRKESPDDLEVLNQRIVTVLRQNQSNAAFSKAAALYGDVNADSIVDKTKSLPAEERATFVRTHILFLAMKRQKDQALALLAQAIEKRILEDKAGEELRALIES